MRRSQIMTASAAAAVLAFLGGTAAAASQPQVATSEPAGAWIVVLEDDTAPGTVAAQHSRRYGVEVGHVYRSALKGYSARMSGTAVTRVREDPRVSSVQRDRVVSAVAKPGKPGTGPVAETTPTGVLRVNGQGGPNIDVDVAVIDTGVDLDHPDLNVNITAAKNCSSGTSADDGNGHGTHVAGTIGAVDNTIGVVGVAPGARIWPVRVLNNAGSGTWSAIICGIDYVTLNAEHIEVANMSLGGTGTDSRCGTDDDAMHEAICSAVEAGVTFTVAAGNESDNAANHVPAAYDEVITVSALADFNGLPGGGAAATCRSDVDDTFANFSNYGADVDLIAPGVCISSTWKGGGYKTISGTSMASPHVAGGAALWAAGNVGASPTQVKSQLQSSGSILWNDVDDPDNVKERLLDVGGF